MIKGLQDIVPEPFQGMARGIEGVTQTVPGARILTDMLRIQRQGVAGKALGKWLGINDEVLSASRGKLTDDVVETALSTTDELYASLGNGITETVPASKFTSMVDDAVERGLIIEDKAAKYKASDMTTGEKVIALRSELRGLKRTAKDNIEQQHIDESIQKIQQIVDKALEGTDLEDVSRLADKRYARWMQMKNTSAIDKDGTVRRHALSQMLKKGDARSMLGQRGSLDPETDALVNTMKDWNKLGPEMPSSGTAERTAAYDLLKTAGAFFSGAAIF